MDQDQPSTAESLEAVKARLRQSFVDGLPERMEQCRADLAALNADDATDEDVQAALQRLHLSFHTLKGSGASLGLDTLARCAEPAEQAVREALTQTPEQRASAKQGLITTMSARMDTIERELLDQTARPPSVPDATAARAEPVTSFTEAHQRDHRMVYLCDDDPHQLRQLANQLACFGYPLKAFDRLEVLKAAMLEQTPAAVVIDIVFPEGENAGPDMLAALRQRLDTQVPAIFISSRDDFSARLCSVRAGSSAFCPKPVNIPEMVEFLDHLTNPTPPEQFNILIVDDEPELVQLHAATLEAAGMNCQVVTAPEQVLGVLERFRADLVLMDLHMPRCSGQELASMLRQIPGYVSLPIIFLSSETNQERQFQALQAGADGFLVKPIEPRRLIDEVRLRAERMRTLRSLMVRDSLTGLFNHNTILQFLELAVANARRNDSPLCFAMLDVDHFKQVNDTQGHPAGDHVLMALSRTLRLRLRDSDLIGRYGGEEFAVVLNDTTLEDAIKLIDALRTDFSRIQFQANGSHFHCTFSAGIATYPNCPDPRRLTETADHALYSAKHAGRDQVASQACDSATW
ncbi:Stalked cell differentiation-controlling protein [Thiorhodovibrio winogradskyi]|uniref:diguanylate cyclase n=2 Tax=Thiorhodovibrio winogradskyi TaxID=77007 RepID=A0ABZ0S567_9GAMM